MVTNTDYPSKAVEIYFSGYLLDFIDNKIKSEFKNYNNECKNQLKNVVFSFISNNNDKFYIKDIINRVKKLSQNIIVNPLGSNHDWPNKIDAELKRDGTLVKLTDKFYWHIKNHLFEALSKVDISEKVVISESVPKSNIIVSSRKVNTRNPNLDASYYQSSSDSRTWCEIF